MPAVDNEAMREKELANRRPGRAPRFAAVLNVDVSPQTHGRWIEKADGFLQWRLIIESVGAKSLNFGFDKFALPDGAALYIIDVNSNRTLGPFTPADNESHEELWTPVMLGDKLMLDLSVPADKREQVQLHLATVNHDFMGFAQIVASGACNVDVMCGAADGYPLIDNYRDIMKSVAVISINGSLSCTGFLVSNTEGDCRPFFMTARHCGLNSGNAAGLVCYWNFYNSYCRPPGSPQSAQNGDGVLTTFNTGSFFRADGSPTDFTLVELDDDVHPDAEAFYAGWDATASVMDTLICVHHPNSEEMRITFDYGAPVLMPYNGVVGGINNHWRTDWDLGTTEGGSSGSPLFNQKKQVIGQLHGGPASCTSSLKYDYYGAFHLSYVGSGSPTNSLKPWLDPNNTGLLEIPGKSAVACAVSVTPAVALTAVCAGQGGTVPLQLGGGFLAPSQIQVSGALGPIIINEIFNNVQPGGVVVFNIPATAGVPQGIYTLDVTATDGTNSASSSIDISVIGGLSTPPNILQPANLSNGLLTSVELIWSKVVNAVGYDLEMSLSPDFVTLLSAVQLTDTIWQTPELAQTTNYFWRVRTINPCGTGQWSPVFKFKTGKIVCHDALVSSDVPKVIPTTVATVKSLLTVSGLSGKISDLNVVGVSGTHTYLSDLTFTIKSPQGTVVTLVSGICGDLNNFNITFDDEAATSPPCPYNTGTAHKPISPLKVFDGQDPNGVWELTIIDSESFDGGSLSSWGLEFCTVSEEYITALDDTLTGCQSGIITYNFVVEGVNPDDLQLNVAGLPPSVVTSFSPTPIVVGSPFTLTLSNLASVPVGSYPFYLITSSAVEGNDTVLLVAHVQNLPALPTLIFPSPQTPLVLGNDITFKWSASAGAEYYIFEIAIGDTTLISNVCYTTQVNAATTHTMMPNCGWNTHYWRVTAVNACGSVSTPFQYLALMTSTTDLPMKYFTLHPNPASGSAVLTYHGTLHDDIEVQVVDIAGRRMDAFRWVSGRNELVIPTADWPSGHYVIHLRGPKSSILQLQVAR